MGDYYRRQSPTTERNSNFSISDQEINGITTTNDVVIESPSPVTLATDTTTTTTTTSNNFSSNNHDNNNSNNNENNNINNNNTPRRRQQRSNDERMSRELLYLNDHFLTEEFRKKCVEVAYDIVTYVCHCGPYEPNSAPSKSTKLMRNLVDDLSKTRGDFMNEMAARIVTNAQSLDDLESLINELASEMFNDDVITWNRIVMFHAFCGYVARYCKFHEKLANSEEIVVKVLTDIVINRLGLWIATCGGWAQFDTQLPQICSLFETESMWKVILFVAAFIGVIVVFYKFIHYLDSSRRI